MSLGRFAIEVHASTYIFARVALLWRSAATQFNIVVAVLVQKVAIRLFINCDTLHKKLQWAVATRIVSWGGAERRVMAQRCRPLGEKSVYVLNISHHPGGSHPPT